MVSTIIKKSIVVGLVVVILDFIIHSRYTTPMETNAYFVFKFILAAYIAYFMFENKFNFFKLPFRRTSFYLYFSGFFSLAHGIYYRILEVIQGQAFFSRVRDVTIGNAVFHQSSFTESIFIWGLIHSSIFLGGILIANKLVK